MPRIEGANIISQQNLIFNPEGLMFSRQAAVGTATAKANDVYGPDRWNMLMSSSSVNVSQTTDAPAGAEHAMLLTKITSAGFFGMCQMFENYQSVPLRNKTLSLGMQVKGTSGVTQVRVSVLGWTGTADSITSSIVSSWASAPTFISNVTTYATQTFAVGTSYSQIKLSAPVDGACNNLMVFVHTTSSQNVNDTLQISAVQMNVGSFLGSYQRRPDLEETLRNQRYCSTYTKEQTASEMGMGLGVNTTRVDYVLQMPVQMRVAPTLISPASFANLSHSDGTTPTAVTGMSVQAGQTSTKFVSVNASAASGLTQFRPYRLEFTVAGANDVFGFDAEL